MKKNLLLVLILVFVSSVSFGQYQVGQRAFNACSFYATFDPIQAFSNTTISTTPSTYAYPSSYPSGSYYYVWLYFPTLPSYSGTVPSVVDTTSGSSFTLLGNITTSSAGGMMLYRLILPNSVTSSNTITVTSTSPSLMPSAPAIVARGGTNAVSDAYGSSFYTNSSFTSWTLSSNLSSYSSFHCNVYHLLTVVSGSGTVTQSSGIIQGATLSTSISGNSFTMVSLLGYTGLAAGYYYAEIDTSVSSPSAESILLNLTSSN